MAILISDELLQSQQLDEAQLRVELACILYEKRILTLGQAARMAQLDRIPFQQALAERDIVLQYELADLEQDLIALEKLGLYGRSK
ncbi:MAG: UPF0175 family protein [Bacteroidia bacterium]|nr:UPF0175 family protein [Bacteroidia bacterium]